MSFKPAGKVTLYISFAVLLGFISISSFFLFGRAVTRIIAESSTNFLKEEAFLYAGTFQVKMKDQLFMLESQVRLFEHVDMDNFDELRRAVAFTKGMGGFKRIAVANMSGDTVNWDGKSSGNIREYDYFKKALKGYAQISSTITTDEDGERVLTLAVPVFQDKRVVGVVTGTFAYSVLDSIFSVDTFNGAGYSMVCDRLGTVLFGSRSASRLCFMDNWIDFFTINNALSVSEIASIYNDMQSNRTGIFRFAINDARRIVVYTPVGLNDWYVFSSVSADYILFQQHQITKISILFFAVLLIVFIIFTVFVTRLLMQKEQAEKDISRYEISSEHSQTVIFEYDYGKQLIEFTGNTDFVFGENLKQLSIPDFEKMSSRIHEQERNLLKKIRSAFKAGETSYSSELRIANEKGDYSWYRISGTLFFDKENQPAKFIGNLVNVNEQVKLEQELKTQAETDLLSGLLNKVYFEKRVTKYISDHKKKFIGVFFIIDLDNFKLVNDKLGHSFGDQAICDTANKISLVFSEKDFIGRIGGDEFCVFMCLKQTVKDVNKIVEKKAETLKMILAEDYSNGETAVPVTPSVGISFYPDQCSSYQELFKRADMALYYVKNSGKNNYAVYDPALMQEKGEAVYE